MTAHQTNRGFFTAIGALTLSLSSLVLFLWQGVALFLRDAGQSSEVVGLLFLAGIPWILRFIWSPLVDRTGFPGIGHFRSWILGTQLVLVVGVLLLAATDPATTPYQIIAILAALSIFMGTQQTAIFGLMAARLAPAERVKGMTVQTVAYASASVLMGLGVLYLLAGFGWRPTVLAIAACSLFFLLIIAPLKLDSGQRLSTVGPKFLSQFAVLRDRRVRRLLGASLLVSVAVASTYGLQSLMLVDAGLSVSDASLVAIVGTGAIGLFGGYLAKPLTERFGGYAVVSMIGLGLAVSCLGFGIGLQKGLEPALVIAAILTNSFFFFGLLPSSKSLLIGYCGQGREATDFAAYSGVEGLFFMIASSIFASLVDLFGYSAILMGAGICALAGANFAWSIRRDADATTKEGLA
ncbi:MAG: MFS transporter [Pseudomonadota bacterium]